MDSIPRPEREAEEIIRRSKLGQLETITSAELESMQFPAVKWAVPGLIPEGLLLLAGKPKMGKSWLALQLGLAVGGGGMAMGGIPVEVGPVLYLALEDRERRLQARQRTALMGGAPVDQLEFAVRCARLDQGGFQQIEDWIKRHEGARLVIIDTLQKIRPRHKPGAMYGDDYDAVERLKFLSDTYNLTILLVHHLRKMGADDPMDEITGSIGLTGAVDGSMVLKRERGKSEATFYVTGRDIDDQELAMSFDMESCLWSIAGKAEEFLRTKERTEIAQVLRDCSPEALSPKEIADLVGKDAPAVRKMLQRMQQDNEIMSVGYGKYKLAYGAGSSSSQEQPPKPSGPCSSGAAHTLGYYWNYRDKQWLCTKCHSPAAGKGAGNAGDK